MEQLQKISFNARWQYYESTQTQDYLNVRLDDSHWEWTTFSELPISNRADTDVLWVRTRFALTPTEACVRYFLRGAGCVYPMTIHLRLQAIAQVDDTDLDVDVTDYVSLDDNVLTLAIRFNRQHENTEQFELYLQPIYCDDLT